MQIPAKNVDGWMSCPKTIIEHPGLAYLCYLNEIIVTKKLDALHKIIGKADVCYTIYNNEDQKVFVGVKRTGCKSFAVKFFNNYGNEVIVIKKPFAFFANRAQVWAPPGNYVGCVEKKFATNTFLVKNRNGDKVLNVKSQSSCCSDYDVLQNDELVGHIKRWTVNSMPITSTDFAVSFPAQMDINNKVILLGACFLIRYSKY
ncbi:unnamed protein product [Chilo suppressalis]|uniref:Phospholipid scramblase n=1 Tax=Chilo suppressalis TaxID=168631 RepID=A0ABN8BBM0_CHISP|nr:unnamed protein product [Chilo suppressalis]